jgi:predicted NBD/HSP70 family sugar kinase
MKKILVACLLGVGVGCGGAKPVPTVDSTPAWLKQGTGAFGGESGKRLQGIGSVSDVRDPKERRKAADAKAQEALEQQADAFFAALGRLAESSPDGDAVVAIGKKTLSAATISDHWVSADGTEQSIDVLELAAFKSALQQAGGDSKLKSEMANNADRAFDQLVRQ